MGIVPNDASVVRLVTAVCVDTHDEWAVAERRHLSRESMARLCADPTPDTVAGEEVPLAIGA